MTMSTCYLKLCLIWLCLLILDLHIHFQFILISSNCKLFYFYLPIKNTQFLKSREVFSLFVVLLLASHPWLIDVFRCPQLPKFFVVCAATCRPALRGHPSMFLSIVIDFFLLKSSKGSCSSPVLSSKRPTHLVFNLLALELCVQDF